VLISLLIAAPLAWWAMQRWLENFAYRAALAWYLYPLAGAAALALALVTAGTYTWSACRVNPADVLRQE
jgi:putative ABC transport system permease protein